MPLNPPAPTKNFSLNELTRSRRARELGIANDPPPELYAAIALTLLGCQRIRDFLGFPVLISSGYRCHVLNVDVGGAEDSQHPKGEAVDFTCPAYGFPEDVAFALSQEMEALGIDQLILEPGWVHVSFTLNPRHEVLRLVGGRYVAGLS
jgi:zinc D-Ala-D-Ala carboxypeptidase